MIIDTTKLYSLVLISSSSSAFQARSLGVHHLMVRFLHRRPFFFNPTIEVVTFHLLGWCMLGVSLLQAFTCLGHECWNACVHRVDPGLYSHAKEK